MVNLFISISTALMLAVQATLAFSPYMDLYAKPHISVVIMKMSEPNGYVLDSHVEQLLNDRSQIMKIRNDSYLCALPLVSSLQKRDQLPLLTSSSTDASDDAVGDDKGSPDAESSIETHQTILSDAKRKALELLEPLRQNCLYYGQDYWLYEMCYGKEVRQFHPKPLYATPEPGTPIFILGALNETEAATSIETIDGSQYFISQTYTEGSVCDLTKDHRTIEVQFKCNPSAEKDKIFSLAEHKTCHYQMVVHTKSLCSEDLFRQVDDSFQVVCKQVVTEQQLASLSLDDVETAFEPAHESNLVADDNLKISSGNLEGILKQLEEDEDDETQALIKNAARSILTSLASGQMKIGGRYVTVDEDFSTVMEITNEQGDHVGRFEVTYQNHELEVILLDEELEEEEDNSSHISSILHDDL